MVSSYAECRIEIKSLADRLRTLRESLNYPSSDARSIALDNCRTACVGAAIPLAILDHGEQSRFTGDHFFDLVGVSGDSQMVANLWEKQVRLALVVLFQFQVENLFKNIQRELTGTYPAGLGYYRVAKELTLSLSNPSRKLELLNLPALIRNSLHSNGIHHGFNGQSTTICVGGYTFEFTHGTPVSCAGWGHIAVALGGAIDVVEELLGTPAVRALPDPIMDQYVWEIATQP